MLYLVYKPAAQLSVSPNSMEQPHRNLCLKWRQEKAFFFFFFFFLVRIKKSLYGTDQALTGSELDVEGLEVKASEKVSRASKFKAHGTIR